MFISLFTIKLGPNEEMIPIQHICNLTLAKKKSYIFGEKIKSQH